MLLETIQENKAMDCFISSMGNNWLLLDELLTNTRDFKTAREGQALLGILALRSGMYAWIGMGLFRWLIVMVRQIFMR